MNKLAMLCKVLEENPIISTLIKDEYKYLLKGITINEEQIIKTATYLLSDDCDKKSFDEVKNYMLLSNIVDIKTKNEVYFKYLKKIINAEEQNKEINQELYVCSQCGCSLDNLQIVRGTSGENRYEIKKIYSDGFAKSGKCIGTDSDENTYEQIECRLCYHRADNIQQMIMLEEEFDEQNI